MRIPFTWLRYFLPLRPNALLRRAAGMSIGALFAVSTLFAQIIAIQNWTIYTVT